MAAIPAEGARLSRLELEATARREAARGVTVMVAESPGRTLTSLRTTTRTLPGINTLQPEQSEAAHAIEHAAHAVIGDLMRLARRARRSWYEIGNALDLHSHAVAPKESVADVAYYLGLEYQAGTRGRAFTWPCPACQQLVTDHGPFRELPNRDEGHADGCARRSAELAEWLEYDRSAASKSHGHDVTHQPAPRRTVLSRRPAQIGSEI